MENGLRIFFPPLLRQVIHEKQLRIILYNCKRGFNLMRNIGKEIRFQSFNAAKLLHHLIKIRKQYVQICEFICGMMRRKINGKISGSYFTGSLRKILPQVFGNTW